MTVKADGSPVTEADLAVNEALRDLIGRERPDWGWLSEETPDGPARLAAGKTIILDPIDGTRTFMAGEPDFAHSLALAEGGRVTAGVVFLPALDRLYSAAADQAARLNGVPLAPVHKPGLSGARLLASKSVFSPDHWRGAVPDATRHFRPSLATRLCLVAEGSFDAFVTVKPAWEWDIAAGALIAERAGARVSDRLGRPVAFNTGAARADGLIVAGEPIWKELAEGLA